MNVFVLDTTFQSVGVIDVFNSFLWTDRFYKYGDFEIYTEANAEILELLKEDYYLEYSNSEHVMIIEDFEVSSDTEEGTKFIYKGRSLESILDRRIIWTQTTLTGNLQNGIKKLLNENIISPSNADRKIPNFIFQESTDPAITELTLEAQYTGDNLYDTISAICNDKKIGFKVLLNDQNQFVFSLYAGKDRSYKQDTNPYVVFSPDFDNMINSNYIRSKKTYKNVTLVAGEGEGSSRKTVSVGSGSGLERRELYTDARDLSTTTSDGGTISTSEYNNQLTQRGNEKLADCPISESFEGESDTTRMFVFKEDFDIGDVVQNRNEYGQEGRSIVSEMIFSQDEEGFLSYPTFETLPEDENSGIKTQKKTVTPNFETQIVTPDSDYNYLEQVTVKQIPVFQTTDQSGGFNLRIG